MPEKRESFRPDLDRIGKALPKEIIFSDKEEMVNQVISNIRTQGYILEGTNAQLSALAYLCISEIEHLHNVPDVVLDPPIDVDIIWIVSAPGLLLEYGSKPGWSAAIPWLDGCEWEVVGTGFALAEAVTAKRLQKPIDRLTRGDIREYGPWIIYNSNSWENEAVETILRESSALPISPDKAYIYQPSAEDPSYIRTVDQARDIRIPASVQPRRIAISVLAAQWARLGKILAATQSFPENAGVLVVPTPSPRGHEREHAIMETQGAVINVFYNHNATYDPIIYQLR